MKKTRRIVVGSLLALGAALVLWAVLGGGAQTVTLPDGTRLTLRAVQAGTNCSYNFGNPLQRMAAKLPWKWAEDYALGTTARNLATETNLVVWFTADKATKQAGTLQFRFVHDAGTNDCKRRALTLTPTRPKDHVWRFYTDFWPRRSRSFTLQAFANDAPPDAPPLWEFRVRNPLHREYPEWQSEVLPGRRTVGGTTFTLEGLVEEGYNLPATYWRQFPEGISVETRLRITRDGQAADDWEVIGMQFQDATGNRFQWLGRSTKRDPNGDWRVGMLCPLLAGERAGKLGVAFGRTKQIDINEIFEVKGIALNVGKGMQRPTHFHTNVLVGSVMVSVAEGASWHGSGTDEFDGYSLSVISLEPRLRDIAEPGARWFLPLQAKDDLGRTFSFTNSPLDFSSIGRITLPGDAKVVDITVAAPRVVFVQYTVGRESITPAPKRRD